MRGDVAGRPDRASERARQPAAGDGGGCALVCAACHHRITATGERIEIDSLHEHTQINPHGFVWSFGCFARAPGCKAIGRPSVEFAWFSGHSWVIAVCRGCGVHLGWRFESAERQFYGLIVGRVVECPDRELPRP